MSVNQVVDVNAFYFSSRSLRSFPKQIEWGGARHTFSDGLQYVVGKGSQAVKLFDMSDGRTTYRLRLQNGTWTLLETR